MRASLAACRLLTVLLAATVASAAWAQQYPTKPIRIVAPFGPGGLVDVLARATGEKLRGSLGQPVIVDNRPGSGGNIGADIVARAEPDGYTLLMSSAGILSINEALYPKMSFNPQTAFTPVSLVAEMNMLAVVNNDSPMRTAGDLIATARKEPGKLNFGSPGNGTTGHLGMELFQYAAKVKLTHVPYKSAAEAVLALIGNQIQGVFDNPPTVLPHIRAGRLRALAYAAPKRFALLPDVPTFDESGLKGFEASSWFGLGGAREDAASDRQSTRAGDREGAARARRSEALRGPRREPRRQHAGPVRRFHPRRNEEMARRGARGRHSPAVK